MYSPPAVYNNYNARKRYSVQQAKMAAHSLEKAHWESEGGCMQYRSLGKF